MESANILLHNSAKSTYFASELLGGYLEESERSTAWSHLSSADGQCWKLGDHDKLDMFEPVWCVQHVNVE